ncbi:MAG: hypothetical protein AAFX95_21510 [Cyanobacteria bacterium J06639_16]
MTGANGHMTDLILKKAAFFTPIAIFLEKIVHNLGYSVARRA